VSDVLPVTAHVPLALLEAMRNLDRPLDDGFELPIEDSPRVRLGLSDTVAAQIERYEDILTRDGTVSLEEALGVLRLVGRRPDADLIFADAGRRTARYLAARIGPLAGALHRLPLEALRTRVGARAAARVARHYLRAELADPRGPAPRVRVATPLSVAALQGDAGCAFYAAAFAELLRVLVGFEGTMIHEACRAHGASACEWRGVRAGDYG